MSGCTSKTAGSGRYFSPEFKAQTVAFVKETGKSIGEVTRDLDLTESAVREWVRQAPVCQGDVRQLR